MKKVVIIGGMAAGCKTAARLKRIKPDYQVTIIEKKSFVSYGTCGMPFYASGDIDDFFELVNTPWGVKRDEIFFKDVKDIQVLTNTEATKIDHSEKKVYCQKNVNSVNNEIKQTSNNSEFSLDYDYLVFATGAKPVKPSFPCPESDKISDFHNPLSAKIFKEKAQTGAIGTVVIIGGGFIGCELAEAMVSLWGIETHLIELSNRLMPMSLDSEISKLLEKTLTNENINLHLQTNVEKIELDNVSNPIIILNSGETIICDYVFICIGIKPDISLAQTIGVEKGKLCGIKTNEFMQTNMPDVWAAGDCVEVYEQITGLKAIFPLGSLANRQGRAVADSIAGLNSKFAGATGINSIKVFGFIVASCGLTEYAAKLLNYEYACVWGTWQDKPDYMPESKTLFGKLVYEKNSMRLLGLQLAGRGEVTRYIDVFSIMVSRHLTVEKLLDYEHAYTPTHSNPMNPLNYLGAMAQAQENYNIKCENPLNIMNFKGQIIDLREKSEINAEKCPIDAIEIGISEYRKKFKILDKEKSLLAICQKGPRSYEVSKILKHNGFKEVSYLGGGLQLAKVILDKVD